MQDMARIQPGRRRGEGVTNKRDSVMPCDNDPTIQRGRIITTGANLCSCARIKSPSPALFLSPHRFSPLFLLAGVLTKGIFNF